MTTETKEFLFKFLEKEVPLDKFETWIYQNRELEKTQPTLYQDLILTSFVDKDARSIIENKIKPYLNIQEFNIWRTKKLLNKIISDEIDIVLGTRKLRQLYFETNEELIPPTLGIGYDSELDDLPTPDEYEKWNPTELQNKLRKADNYRDNIKNDAKEFLKSLDRRG